MNVKLNSKYFIANLGNLIWWMQKFIRLGTIYPTIKDINPKRNRIFILGNGPSLTHDVKNYIKYLKNEDIMMVNQALTNTLAFNLKPTYYTLMDPAYWGCYNEDENQDNRLLNNNLDLNNALNEVNWKMNILVPYSIYNKRTNNSILINNSNISVKTFNSIEVVTFKKLQRYLYKTNMGIPSGINVLITCLCCAIAMNYKEIFLLGADSDWHKQLSVDNDNKVYSYDTHYYHDNATKVYVPYTLSFVCECITNAFKAYQELGSLNFNITNLSSNSMIDAFPRNSIENILGGGKGII